MNSQSKKREEFNQQNYKLMMMYMNNQAFQGSYAYDKASAASLVMLAIYIVAALIVYFLLLRDKDEAKLKKAIRQERRELKRGI